ncbi:MAG: hypothetical protein Tsb002_37520 [Wenzhouxiangellaceae bacterium]
MRYCGSASLAQPLKLTHSDSDMPANAKLANLVIKQLLIQAINCQVEEINTQRQQWRVACNHKSCHDKRHD